MPKKIIIELVLHPDADSGRVEDVVDRYLDDGALQDDINSEAPVGEDEDEGDKTVTDASCYVQHVSPPALLQLAREIVARSESETDCNTADDACALALLVIASTR